MYRWLIGVALLQLGTATAAEPGKLRTDIGTQPLSRLATDESLMIRFGRERLPLPPER